MTILPSETNPTSLSIPGTHDSLTANITYPVYQTQNNNLRQQLHSGIRYFDVRARVVNNTLQIYHEDTPTGYSYTDVLLDLFTFLENNPGEAILMRLKEESASINSTIDFVTAFNNYRLNDTITSPGCEKHFWIPSTPGPTSVPTLGELRSKILILQNFGSDPAEYGIKWESPLLSIEDLYEIPDLAALDEKFEAIQEGIQAAGNGTEHEDGILYLSHLSASVGVLPIEAAAGTMNGSVVGMNDRTGEWLKSTYEGTTGVVMIDFPGKGLVREILSRNSLIK